MFNPIRACFFVIAYLLMDTMAFARNSSYGSLLCKDTASYSCHTVPQGETWAVLFPDAQERDMVMRINRLGNELKLGMRIAIPHHLSGKNVLDFAPFPREITPVGEKIIFVSLDKLAWGAYDGQGSLVRWGAISSALGYCADIKRACNTPTGKFNLYRKAGAACVSSKYPIGRGGAPMPYCMFFKGGFAMHGSYDVPGYNASHGCIRMVVSDAQWLNQEFLATEVGTPIIITQQ